jgi:hypothetical protein
MRRILALQKLEVAAEKHMSLAGSATSSVYTCCNPPD